MFLEFLAAATRRFGWSVSAFVLMTNHFHLVLKTPEPNLSRGMQWLNGKYAGRFNARHKRCGHLFQGRFKAVLVEKETYFANVLRYVVLNPVRAGIVERPEDFRWSSYRATAGLEAAPDWLDVSSVLTAFDGGGDEARERYRGYVLSKIGVEDDLWQHLSNGIYLGSETWAKVMRATVESKPRSTDTPRAHRSIGRPKMQAIVDVVARVARTTIETIRTERGHPLKALVAWIGWHEGLITLRSIAASLRLRSEGHISKLVRCCEQRFSTDTGLLDCLDGALAMLRA
jgi:REP element-mobilizing transposase RayT